MNVECNCEARGLLVTGPHSHTCEVCGDRALWGLYTTPRCARHRTNAQGGALIVRVKARGRMIASNVPDDAEPGDLVVGNRGAAARVIEVWTSSKLSSCLTLEYAGNYRDAFGPRPDKGRKLYDFS